VETVVVEGVLKNPFLVIEKRLSPEVKDILSLQPELNFDENGQLYYEEEGDPRVQFCVDSYPVNDEFERGEG